jgi:hypothetical protein
VQTLKPGIVYFLPVFGTGFVLRTFRVLLVVPYVGHRASELFEMPVMPAGELAVGIGLRNMTAADIMLNRNPVSGTAYYASLILFATMPWLVSRR